MSRNLFELDNARNLLAQELVETFVNTPKFDQLLSATNQIVIGSRGSGKTALLKMLSHDHLSIFNNDKAREIIQNKTYIGIFISTKTRFIGGLQSSKETQTLKEKEERFQWQLNIASCAALLQTLKSCLNCYINNNEERVAKEIQIIKRIRKYWFDESDEIYTINAASQKIEDIYIERQKKNVELAIKDDKSLNPVGISFCMELYDPLFAAIKIINRELNFPETTSWFICIDEIEMLEDFHYRILNSYLRTSQDNNAYFKFTTLPYHYTTETNLSVPLEIRHDVQYLYIDQDPTFLYRIEEDKNGALQLFRKRAKILKHKYANYSFEELFGSSKLLDDESINYSDIYNLSKTTLTSDEIKELLSDNENFIRFFKYANDETKEKGINLLKCKNIKAYDDQIGRKMRGLLYLKEQVDQTVGHKSFIVYSGAKAVITLGDCNPRKLITIFKEMLNEVNVKKIDPYVQKRDKAEIPFRNQTLVLTRIAGHEHSRYKQEKDFGTTLYDFIEKIGKYMQDYIHKQKIGTEQISSIEIKDGTNQYWLLIERAVERGLLYPNININNPNELPEKEGVFHLAYILSPKFKLMPRRGDSRNISNIIDRKETTTNRQFIINF